MRAGRSGRRGGGGLLEDHVRVRAAQPERAHPGPARLDAPGQGRSAVFTKNGLDAKSIFGFGSVKCRLAGGLRAPGRGPS